MSLTQAFVKYASVLGVALSGLALIMIMLLAMSVVSSVFIAITGLLAAIAIVLSFFALLAILTNPPDSGWFR